MAERRGDILIPHAAFGGPIKVGEPTRISLSDSRDIPTIVTSYAGPVPILHASAGVRRVASIAYMLALTWREHRLAAKRLGRDTCKSIVLLVPHGDHRIPAVSQS